METGSFQKLCGVVCCDSGKKILVNITDKTYVKPL